MLYEFHNFGKIIRDLKKQLAVLKLRQDVTLVAKYNKIHTKLSHCLNQEEIYWKQRAKQFWLREGDKNTKFFHNYASTGKRKNQIGKLRDPAKNWVEGDNMRTIIFNYFANIFQFGDTQEVGFFDQIPKKVT